jgi:hypothetical protein
MKMLKLMLRNMIPWIQQTRMESLSFLKVCVIKGRYRRFWHKNKTNSTSTQSKSTTKPAPEACSTVVSQLATVIHLSHCSQHLELLRSSQLRKILLEYLATSIFDDQ